MNNNQLNSKDIWIIHYSVPNKNKDDLLRPFIIVNILNNQIYGIPLTSYKEERYKKESGDFIFENQFLKVKSIIKPYQIIKIKPEYFKNKIGTVDDEIINKINNNINFNVFKYLSMKNINAIIREYTIEKQNQKIIDLELQNEQKDQEITKLKFKTEELNFELKLTKNKLLSQEKDFELE